MDRGEARESDSVSHEPSTSKTPREGEKEDTKKEKNDEKTKTVPFYKLFAFADSIDVFLMICGSVGAMGNGVCLPLMTLLFGDLIDSFGQNQNNKDIVDVISKVCLKFVYLGLGTLGAAFIQVASWMITGERQAARIRSMYLKTILRQDIGFFDVETNTGEVVGRMSGDTVLIQDAMGEKVGKFIQLVSTFVGGFALAFVKGWLLTLVMLTSIPLLAMAGAAMAIIVTRASSRGQAAYAKAATVVEQTIGSIRTVASFTGEKQAINSYKKFITSAYEQSIKQGFSTGLGLGVMFMVFFSSYALAIWFGGKMIVEKGYTGGAVINVIIIVVAGSMSLGQTSPCLTAFAAGQAAAYKMFETIKRKPLIDAYDEIDTWWWLSHKGTTTSFLCISLFALLIRSAVSMFPYSGAGTPPKFGDFEAQRHWMEITTNLPAIDWYRNGTHNDLTYWGLDYPPLTAYQSYIHGLLLRFFNPDSVSLFSSRGHESYIGKLLMRWTVLSSDALIFFPAALFFVLVYHRNRAKSQVAWHIAIILLNPCLILIDHGHFQYNCISLGLTVGAIAAVLCGSEVLTCVFFTLALSHKQMSAYFAPAFFSHLLGKCLRRKNPILSLLKLGIAVIATFVIVWWPYLHSVDDFLMVLSRLAPFERGIYEDYVANFWCTTSILIKWKKLFTTPSLKFMSLAATVLASLPSMVHQIFSPSNEGFLYGLLNSSMAFYLFSFQVHEKSILMPFLAATLLALKIPDHFNHLTYYALFSMFPLLCRDNLLLPYLTLHLLFTLIYHSQLPKTKASSFSFTNFPGYVFLLRTHFVISLVLHVVYLTIQPPQKYPFLFDALIMILCFSYFVMFAIYTNYTQWNFSSHFRSADKEKKQI